MSRKKKVRTAPVDPCDQILDNVEPNEVLKRLNTCERKSESKFRSSRALPLIEAVEDIELSLITSFHLCLGGRDDLESPVRPAIAALCAGTLHLSRLAYGSMARGYPIQSLVLVRAVFERVAMAMVVRNSPALARLVLDQKVRTRDLPDWARSMKQEAINLFDEYMSLYGDSGLGDLAVHAKIIPRVYGELSKFTHPQNDALPLQFGVDEASGNIWFQIGPNNNAIPYAVLALTFLYTLLVFSCLLLLVMFHSPSDEWKVIHAHFVSTLQKHSGVSQSAIDQILMDYQVSEE